jgi:hypothetical protein
VFERFLCFHPLFTSHSTVNDNDCFLMT